MVYNAQRQQEFLTGNCVHNFKNLTGRAQRHFNVDSVRLASDLSKWCDVPESINSAHLTRRSEWFAARFSLFTLLQQLGSSAKLVMHPVHGYPELQESNPKTNSNLFTSWSHSDDFVAVVVGKSPVGVDVEPVNRSVEKVRERIATDEEFAKFETNPLVIEGQAIPTSLALWCAKEAVAKASGLGMRWGLKNFELQWREGEIWPVTITQHGPRALKDPAIRYSLREGFLVAVCGSRAELLEPPSWA